MTEWLDENLFKNKKFTDEINLDDLTVPVKYAHNMSTNCIPLSRLDAWKLRVSLRQALHNYCFLLILA